MKKALLVITGIIVLAAIAAGCAPEPAPEPHGEAVSRQVALEFVKNEATFVYDGMEDTLKLVKTEELSAHSWRFSYEFQSRHSGYGDRTGQVLLQVITPHQAVVTVTDGQVVKAIMDGKWDMTKQEMLP